MSLYEELSKPFASKFVQQKPGRNEDYVNHAVVTNRLNGVLGVGGWDFRVVERSTYAGPDGQPHVAYVVGEIELRRDDSARRLGGTRQDIGVPSSVVVEAYERNGKTVQQTVIQDEIKTAVSDALKRCAMRFGVAIQLWHNQLEEFGGEQGLAGVVPSPPSTPSQGENSDPRPASKEAGGVGEDPPASAPTFDELVAIAGSTSKAREAINEASAADYTPARVRLSSDLERIAARALLLGVEA